MKSSNPIVDSALVYAAERKASNAAGEYPTPDGIWLRKVGSMGHFKLLTRNGDVAAEFNGDSWRVVPGKDGEAARYVIRKNWKGTVLGSVSNARAKVGDMVVYGGGPHVVVKDLGGGKYVLRSKSTGRSFAVTAAKGFEVLEPGSYAVNARFREGDVVEVIGAGCASKGWVGRISKVSSHKAWPYEVTFPAGKYSNDFGEYAASDLRKAYNGAHG